MSDGLPRRVFITGALGFIGSVLAARLREQGSEVRGVDQRADASLGVVAGDVASPGVWQQEAAGSDLVIHTAALISMKAGLEPFWRVNVVGTRNAVSTAARAGAARFVHLSSIVAFGFDPPRGVDENRPPKTNGVPYVDTKVASEQVVLQSHAAGEQACTIVRPADVYGPGSRPWTLLPVEELRRGRLLLPAMGKGLITPVYVDNLVDGILLAATRPEGEGQVFTIGDGTAIETREFFGHYARMLGKGSVPVAPTSVARLLAAGLARFGTLAGRETEVNENAVDYLTRQGSYSIEKARSALGYEPMVDLDEGMRRTEEWLRERALI